MKRSASLCAMLAFLMLFATMASAQEQAGSIQGVVKDSSGSVLPGVTVEARSPSVVGVNTATTDTNGVYRFPALPPGRYGFVARLTGFGDKTQNDVELTVGQVLKIDIVMGLAGVTETLTVTAESPIIDVKQNVATGSITRDLLERIPRGRDFTTALATAPGTNEETRNGGLQID